MNHRFACIALKRKIFTSCAIITFTYVVCRRLLVRFSADIKPICTVQGALRGTDLQRVRVNDSQLYLPSLTKLSVAGCG